MAVETANTIPVFDGAVEGQVAPSTMTGIVLMTAGVISAVPKGGYDPTTDLVFVDDFIVNGSGTGNIGYGWQNTNGTVSNIASEANHPGITRLSTSSTQNTLAHNDIHAFDAAGYIDPASNFDITFIFRCDIDTSNLSMKIGMSNSCGSLTPSNGIYVERLGADTSWFGVTRSGGSQTRTAALVTSAANTWFKFRIRRVDASTIGFTANALSEVNATATIPTAQLTPYWLITNPASAAAAIVDVDLYSIRVSGLTR